MRCFTGHTRRLVAAAVTVVLAAGWGGGASAAPAQGPYKHVIVIYQENWPFDGLYGKFAGANGLSDGAAAIPQIDKVTGAPIATLPQPLIGSVPDPNFAAVAGMPVGPYDASKYVSPAQLTGDLVHRFYQEQSQIDGGKMDKFMTWSDNPGLVFSTFDVSAMPEGRLAARYTLADNGFHSAFGGSFLNHFWLICACTPVFPNAPAAVVATVDGSGKQLALDASGKIVHDGFVTPDGFAVNTAFTVNSPHPKTVPAANLVPNQTLPTIGDRMNDAHVSWKWYAGGWNDALAGNPDPNFQFHHQPFAYFANYADGTPGRAAHLRDESDFLADLNGGTLPDVSFVKPIGANNEHPGYATLVAGQQHVADLVAAIRASRYWNDAAIIISYDENGGRWDHVAPPVVDRWGPGTRVPFILISSRMRSGSVDHKQYETVSILAFVEKVYSLKPLGSRDAAADPFSGTFGQ